MRGNDSAIADRASLVRNDETTLVPQYLSALVSSKRAAFTKPSRGTSDSERRTIINGNRAAWLSAINGFLCFAQQNSNTLCRQSAFRFDCERCRLMRGAAFTLAEVLITLGIIGVVAAMTLPTLIAKHQEKVLAVSIRKLYSDVNNAARLSQAENEGYIDYSTIFNPDNTNYETALAFAKYFNGAKVCKNLETKDCKQYQHKIKYSKRYENGTGKAVDTDLRNYPVIILNTGAMLYIAQAHIPNCYQHVITQKHDENGYPLFDSDNNPIMAEYDNKFCALIYFDVNGTKMPNRFGQDASRILIDKTKILPSTQPYEGKETLINILSGKDEFVYEDYKVGE